MTEPGLQVCLKHRERISSPDVFYGFSARLHASTPLPPPRSQSSSAIRRCSMRVLAFRSSRSICSSSSRSRSFLLIRSNNLVFIFNILRFFDWRGLPVRSAIISKNRADLKQSVLVSITALARSHIRLCPTHRLLAGDRLAERVRVSLAEEVEVGQSLALALFRAAGQKAPEHRRYADDEYVQRSE